MTTNPNNLRTPSTPAASTARLARNSCSALRAGPNPRKSKKHPRSPSIAFTPNQANHSIDSYMGSPSPYRKRLVLQPPGLQSPFKPAPAHGTCMFNSDDEMSDPELPDLFLGRENLTIRPRHNSLLVTSTPPRNGARSSPLSLADINAAPRPKRRSVDSHKLKLDPPSSPSTHASPSVPLPKLVFTPPSVLASSSFSSPRLVFPSRYSTPDDPPKTPPQDSSTAVEDWRTLSSHSESMTKLSLCDEKLTEPDSPSRFGSGSRVLSSSLSRIPDGEVPKFERKRTESAEYYQPPTRHRKINSGQRDSLYVAAPFFSLEHDSPSKENAKPRSTTPAPLFTFQPTPSPFLPMSYQPTTSHPSPVPLPIRAPQRSRPGAIQQKSRRPFKPRDSGIAGISFDGEDEGVADFSFSSVSSVGTDGSGSMNESPGHMAMDIDSEINTDFVTPGFAPGLSSGWPAMSASAPENSGEDMDARIFANLAARHRNPQPNVPARLVMPDTPVKGAGNTTRLWKSASKVPIPASVAPKVRGAPRKSLPVRFPDLLTKTPRFILDTNVPPSIATPSPDSVSPDSIQTQSPTITMSPTLRVAPGAPRKSYGTLGIGRPVKRPSLSLLSNSSTPKASENVGGSSELTPSASVPSMLAPPTGSRADMLRRPSSGAWSIDSEGSIHRKSSTSSDSSMLGTPTKGGGPIKWRLPGLGPRKSAPVGPSFKVPPPKIRFSLPTTSGPTANSSSPPMFARKTPTASRIAPQPSPSKIRNEPISQAGNNSFSMLTDSEEDFFDETSSNARKAAASSSGFFLSFDAAQPTTEVELEHAPGRMEKQFVCIDRLGAGTFGQVWKVEEKGAAILPGGKKPAFAIKRSKRFEGPKHRARLLEEVDILRHLTTTSTRSRLRRTFSVSSNATFSPSNTGPGCSNVLHFISAWEQDSMLFIRTELCELGNLADFLLDFGQRYNRLDEPRVWKILAELSNGLLHIHHANVIHLDLKPANVFITVEGRLRIGDFGMASRWPRPMSLGGAGKDFEREGDREYMAPEILRGQYGREADIFSLGMIMLECAGNIIVPDMGDPWHRLRAQDFSDIDMSGLTPTLINLIANLMSPEPDDRPPIEDIWSHEVVKRTRGAMRRNMRKASQRAEEQEGSSVEVMVFSASAFGTEGPEFLAEIFGEDIEMDVGL